MKTVNSSGMGDVAAKLTDLEKWVQIFMLDKAPVAREILRLLLALRHRWCRCLG